jgi:large subunit ribosomal protein L17
MYSRLRRNSSQRKALFRDLATDLILNDKIVTTYSKAKELQKVVDSLVQIAKKGDNNAYRELVRHIRFEHLSVEESQDDKKKKKGVKSKPVYAVDKLLKEVAPRYADRNGGYTRVIKTDIRRGDATLLAIIEFV